MRMLFIGVGVGVLCVIAGLPLGIRGNDEREWDKHNDVLHNENINKNIPTEWRPREVLTLPPSHFTEEVLQEVKVTGSHEPTTQTLIKPNVLMLILLQALAVTIFLKYHVSDEKEDVDNKNAVQNTPPDTSFPTPEASTSEQSTGSSQSDTSIRHRSHASGARCESPSSPDKVCDEEDVKKPFRVQKSAYVWGRWKQLCSC
eukprot:TRINITY_DN10467_c0_g1_i1.p1 TRINITY_DN10467_c0_g1~~TRINITY_DN10467_c0_g1_i1.p1  ORF type:complete len:201 (+),score=41.54 TRINITY_DN10467_c0_g1_i1:22-624(+)